MLYLNYSMALEKISVVYLNPYATKISTDIFSSQTKLKNLAYLKAHPEFNNFAIFDISLDRKNIRGIFFKGKIDI